MRLEDDGIDVVALEAALGQGPVKLAHIIPNFHNPAGCTLSAEKRTRIIELAAEHELTVFEDDPYRLVRFGAEPPATMLSLDSADRVVHASSSRRRSVPASELATWPAPAS